MQALVDDLRAWLAGRPVAALRLSLAARALRWCGRNPWVAGLLLAVTAGGGFGVWRVRALGDEIVRDSAVNAAAQQARMLEDVNLGRLIETLTLTLGIPMRSASSTTLVRKDQRRAVEADECYYVANEARIRHLRKLRLARDPPPDLVVEVDISRSSRARLRIHAAIGVPEVWQWIGDRLAILQLGEDGAYAEREQSTIFPMLPMARVLEVIRQRHDRDETELMREFQDWVRATLRK